MTYRYCGICTDCGSSTYVPEVWHGVFPPRPECISCNKVVRTPRPTMDTVRQEIKETKEIIEKIRENRKEFEKNINQNQGVLGPPPPTSSLEDTLKEINTKKAVCALQEAIDDAIKAEQEETSRLSDLEARMNRLEMMMITASEQLTSIKNAVNRFSDVLNEARRSGLARPSLSDSDLEKL